ncbi:PQQ-dependent sugar dehydrogenase [Notoacmeibacter ruber]|uniref:PQQ-dependent sugar dehydrogenase n=1 Tax=Notoacmeibacter ruber TaxID=2670375 RepID=A0A3L7J9M8_9HYPH|nr:PQQ-dependent sugar dehydrogenase [Notoacmeibacter ruber]RLQ87393.1 PQQ-dependent sugar dehydrogenase [Notoacmeibacter ruber]
MTAQTILSSLALSTLIALPASAQDDSFSVTGTEGTALAAEAVTDFDEPWAMTFLPDGTALVTTKPGTLFHVTQDGEKTEIQGMWEVAYGGQGGLGDVVLHPDFEQNNLIYLSYVESLDDGATKGAAVSRAKLDLSGDTPKLTDIEKIWTQQPHVPGSGHFSHRIAFGPKGSDQEGYLFLTSGERQKQTPAQDKDVNLGKILRLNDDGSLPEGNPFAEEGGEAVADEFWTTGHRNMLGIAFDGENRLWAHEMGPRGGDELNLIEPGNNYGWPQRSYGDNYSGVPITDHSADDGFTKPKAYWNPVISPAGLVIYSGDVFSDWQGDALIGGLSSKALIQVDLDGETAQEAERFEWGKRIREVEQGPDGAIWVLEDEAGGRLVKLTPA